jgi:PTH1 family peptidyl-tRNA hydrolase
VFLFVGLGNPGKPYQHTRHNLGFRVLERIAEAQQVHFHKGPGPYQIAKTAVGSNSIILAQPLTYMNRSGIAVYDLVTRYQISLEQMVVVCDDIHVAAGKMRIRMKGSDGGHNGLASIIRYLCSESFPRMRMGIGMPVQGDVIEFVLSPFLKEEEKMAEDMIDLGVSALLKIAEYGLGHAMNTFNR